jgi:hypothetical protein
MNKIFQDTIDVDDCTFAVYFEEDCDSGPPWLDCDGHGPVSDWTTRDKRPGELVLSEAHGSRRYYDFSEACRIARRDQWGYTLLQGTPRQRAAEAARRDFDYLRSWCNDGWRYVGVIVELLDDDGDGTGIEESCWGVESDGDGWKSVATDLAHDIISAARRMAA